MPDSRVKPSFIRLCTADYRRTIPGQKTDNLTARRQHWLSSGRNRANARQPGEAQLHPAVHCGLPAHNSRSEDRQSDCLQAVLAVFREE